MKKNAVYKLILITFLSFVVIGCGGKYSNARVGSISTMQEGTIEGVEAVRVKSDSPYGSIFGMIIGGIVGHQIGSGSGQSIATMAGSVVGSAVGDDANSVEARRVMIRLDNGKSIVTIVKKDEINPYEYVRGDRVRIFITEGKVTEIRPIK